MRNNKATKVPDYLWQAYGLPVPKREFKFYPTRKWRFDFAWPDKLLAVELEGAVWVQGRHTRGTGYTDDMEKYNAAIELEWRVLRYPVCKGTIDAKYFVQIRTVFNN
jgi:hypothetical protein